MLAILSDGEAYGYQIIQRVQRLSGGKIELTTGTLYPHLHRMEADGLVQAEWKEVPDAPRRKYYQLTGAGKKALAHEKQQWIHTTVVPLEDFRIDVLRHSCSFREDGLIKYPTVIHWTRHHMRRYYYRRENLKLILNERLPLPGSVISNLVNSVMNPVQAVGIFVYRVLKAITGRAPFKWRPVLPMKRYV